MSDFEDVAGEAGLNDEDVTEITEVDDDELVPEVDDVVVPDEDDGSLAEKGEEDEEAELFNEYLFGDDANAM